MTQPEGNYRVSVKALIINQDGALLMRQSLDNEFDLYGGGMDHGESPQQAMTREIKEELGVDLLSMEDTPAAVWTFFNPTLGRHIMWLVYRVKVEPIESTIDAEGWPMKYLTAEELPSGGLDTNFDGYIARLQRLLA